MPLEPLAGSRILLRYVLLVVIILSVVADSTMAQAPSATPAQATSSQGDKTGQAIPVNQYFCDAYLPYSFSPVSSGVGANSPVVTQEFKWPVQTLLARPDVDSFLSIFLKKDWTTFSPVGKNGTLNDPGYPLLGDPTRALNKNGTDVSRLLIRLFQVDAAGKPSAQQLCSASVPPRAPSTPPDNNGNTSQDAEYFLLHIVRWKSAHGSYSTSSSDWYIFNKSDAKSAHRQFPFRFHPETSGSMRIFGDSKVFFLSVHLAPIGRGVDPKTGANHDADDFASFAKAVAISYKMDVKKLEPANIQDLKALIGVVAGATAPTGVQTMSAESDLANYKAFLQAASHRSFAGLYGAAELTGLQHLPVQITATMTATLPKADQTLPDAPGYKESLSLDIVKAVPSASPSKATPPSTSAVAGSSSTAKTAKVSQQTSSSSCSAAAGGSCTETMGVQNEGLYVWDVSVGVPFKGYKEVKYDYSNTGAVTPKTISKGTAYGFVVLAPWKEDIVTPPSLGIPHLLVGLPLSGKVFDAPVFAAGETINLAKLPRIGPPLSKVIPFSLRFYAGIVYNKQFTPTTATSTSSFIPSHRVAKLQYGIEFSVREIASKLTNKAATSSSSSTSKAKTK